MQAMTVRNCESCPSFLTQEAAAAKYPKDPGAPTCLRFSELLGKPGMMSSVAVGLRTSRAEACDQYGEAAPTGPINYPNSAFTVAAPDPEIVNGGFSGSTERPTTCSDCSHFIPPTVVRDELGWPLGLCAATGRLLFPGRYQTEAANCFYGKQGVNRDDTTGVMEHPKFSTGFAPLRVGGATFDSDAAWIEPQDYPTDREVTDDDLDAGIRAWRLVTYPKNAAQFTYLPIFDRAFFDEDEQAKIPTTGDDSHPEWYVDHSGLVYRVAVSWMGVDKAPLLIGDAGGGKTELLRHMGWLMGLPVEIVAVTSEMMIETVEGETKFQVPLEKRGTLGAVPETWWKDGVAPRRWGKPGILGVDELNTGQPAVGEFLRPMTDNRKSITVDDTTRERHPFCFLGLTINPAYKPLYIGTRELSHADVSRLAHIYVGLPPEAVERQIITRWCETNDPPFDPPLEVVDRVMAIATEIRQLVDDGALPIAWGIREQIQVLTLTQFLDLPDSYKMTITDYLEPSTAAVILGIVSTYNA